MTFLGGELPPPAYFKSITLENVRCFGPKEKLDLSIDGKRPAQWTIILGDNGIGKTSLLRSIIAMEPGYIHDQKNISISKKTTETNNPDIGPRIYDFNFFIWNPEKQNSQLPFKMKADFFYGNKISDVGKLSVSKNNYFGRKNGKYSASSESYSKIGGLICYGYGASRRPGTATLEEYQQFQISESLFSDDTPLINVEQWLLQADYLAAKEGIDSHANKNLKTIKEQLLKVLPDVHEIQISPKIEDSIEVGVYFVTSDGRFKMGELSLGYRTVTSWMVDLAHQLIKRYPSSESPLEEPSVVLIDEIDLHLHPQWQRSIIGTLTNIFPNTQFIVTSHSPLIVQSAVNANLVLLKRNDEEQVNIINDEESIRGWRVDQILVSDLFGIESSRSPEFDDILRRRIEILSKPSLSKKDEEKLREINKELDKLPYGNNLEEIEAMEIIKIAADRLKNTINPNDKD